MFLPCSGKIQCEFFPKAASTAISAGAVLETSGGTVDPADASDTSLFGISLRAVTAADTDYASTTPLPVVMLTPDLEFYADVGTGSATSSLVGTTCDLKDSVSLDVTASDHNVFTITQVIDATHVRGRFNASYMFVNAS